MTEGESRAWVEERTARLHAKIDALPPQGREFLQRWRRCIELAGRASPDVRCADMLMAFVDHLAALLAVPRAEKVAGTHAPGSGV